MDELLRMNPTEHNIKARYGISCYNIALPRIALPVMCKAHVAITVSLCHGKY